MSDPSVKRRVHLLGKARELLEELAKYSSDSDVSSPEVSAAIDRLKRDLSRLYGVKR